MLFNGYRPSGSFHREFPPTAGSRTKQIRPYYAIFGRPQEKLVQLLCSVSLLLCRGNKRKQPHQSSVFSDISNLRNLSRDNPPPKPNSAIGCFKALLVKSRFMSYLTLENWSILSIDDVAHNRSRTNWPPTRIKFSCATLITFSTVASVTNKHYWMSCSAYVKVAVNIWT